MQESLYARCQELVARFDEVYRQRAQASGRELAPGQRAGFLLSPLLEPLLAVADTDQPFPLSRLDVVLSPDGALRVIELNPVGVCTIHLRSVGYLARALRRAGMA